MSRITFLISDKVVKNFVEHAESNLHKTVKRYKKNSFIPLQMSYEVSAQANNDAEIKMKQILLKERLNDKRNLFLVDAKFINNLVQDYKLKKITVTLDVTKDTAALEALKKYNAKFAIRPRINFKQILIPIGSILYYNDDSSITCIVESENKVIFEGQVMYITTAAKIIRKRLGKDAEISGSTCWMFEDEILEKRRKRLEKETSNNQEH